MSGAYPRSHGATQLGDAGLLAAQGLSPLARGNLAMGTESAAPAGPIPARTGQPHPLALHVPHGRAYPRSHGATERIVMDGRIHRGLSPLARGNRAAPIHRGAGRGPIPARTGQPTPRLTTCQSFWAYPRSHGATSCCRELSLFAMGLSPLARGNPGGGVFNAHLPGPIPARTGQPIGKTCRAKWQRAYPRSHGATDNKKPAQWRALGLSPLARGNP